MPHGGKLRAINQLALIGGLLLVSARALGEVDDHETNYSPGQAEVRSEFTIGTSFGAAFGGGTGYPNRAAEIDNPEFKATAPLGVGSGGSFWLGGALRDWLVIGLGLSFYGAGEPVTASMTHFVLHTEIYPLFAQGGAFRDLGLVLEFGAGGGSFERGEQSIADAGSSSLVAAGVVYEPWRFGSFGLGPIVQYNHQFSLSMSAHFVLAGARVAFYGGP